MGRKKVKPPQIDYLKEYAVPRFVTEESICEKYDLSGAQCRKMARAANAFFEIRKYIKNLIRKYKWSPSVLRGSYYSDL